ncbi:hypothetical protein T459_34436 [Capsicum annuum]|uniref:Uncharacterized protein n=1 Tax=Capsicum annuum TaxID=4072 RepID=A0A2G2XW33_CAPAN|nr:hypothetical protein T459_34436 [Capsicum annuum]
MCLQVLDYVEDSDLEEIANSCKELQELRSVLYFCRQMTNDVLVTIARNRPNMIPFRLCIIEPQTPNYSTLKPLDTGFGAIVQHCKELW